MAASGPPAWGGSRDVAESAAHLAAKYGAFISSRKRSVSHPLSRSNPSSDHNEANRNAYALDMATRSGAPLAKAIAAHFGIAGYRTGNYLTYTIRRGGAMFRVQILWAVAGHYDHVHLGVRLTGGTYTYRPSDPLKGLSPRGREVARKLLYHRRMMAREKRSGMGRRFRKHLRWARFYKARMVVAWRLARGPKRRTIERVLKAKDGSL